MIGSFCQEKKKSSAVPERYEIPWYALRRVFKCFEKWWLVFKGFQEEGLVYDPSEVSQRVRSRTGGKNHLEVLTSTLNVEV